MRTNKTKRQTNKTKTKKTYIFYYGPRFSTLFSIIIVVSRDGRKYLITSRLPVLSARSLTKNFVSMVTLPIETCVCLDKNLLAIGRYASLSMKINCFIYIIFKLNRSSASVMGHARTPPPPQG